MPNGEETEVEVGMTETGEDLQDPDKLLRALKSEREARKKLERDLREAQDRTTFTELRSRFPFVEEYDFEGLPRDKWEARAERLAELRGNSASEAGDEQAAQESSEVPEAADLARVTDLGGRATDETSVMTRSDLDKAVKEGRLTPAQGVELLRTGKVALEHTQVRPSTPF